MPKKPKQKKSKADLQPAILEPALPARKPNPFVDFIRKRWLWILLALGLVAYLATRGAGQATASPYQTEAVDRGPLIATIGATGTLRAQQSALLSWGTSGKVAEVNVQLGQRVGADDVLAELSLSSLPQNVILAHLDFQTAEDNLALEVAEAAKALAEAQKRVEDTRRALNNLENPARAVDINQAHANLVLAEDQLDKARDAYEPYANRPEGNLERAHYLLRFTEAQQRYDAALRTYNAYSGTSSNTNIAVAQGDLDVALAQLEIAQRAYDNALQATDPDFTSPAEARLAAAQASRDLARILAPFDGVITHAYPLVGDLVNAGAAAFQVDDLSSLLADVEVSEVDINRVQVGQNVTLTFDAAPDREYHGTVREVALAGTTVSGVVNFRIVVELKDADEYVRPAMTAAVNIVVSELDDVLLVPNRAVRLLDGNRVVYVLRNGNLQAVRVTLGASSDAHSEVLDGDIAVGDQVVLNPPSSLFELSGPPSGGMFGGN